MPMRGHVAVALRILAVLIFLAAAVVLLAADTATFRGNAGHTGEYDSPAMPQLKGVMWTFHAEGQRIASPAVSGETIYLASTAGCGGPRDGDEEWKFATGDDVVHASPAIADGALFIGSWDSDFYALDAAAGKEKWRFGTGPANHNQHGIRPATSC